MNCDDNDDDDESDLFGLDSLLAEQRLCFYVS
jgi:hypothetical protein